MAILKVANIHFDTAGTTLIRANGANTLTFNTAGAEDVRIDPAGNVLIGRTNSTVGNNVKLDVAGGINASAVLVNGQSVIAIFDGANTITNAAFTQANTARTQANTAFLGANAALIQANTARDQGNTAFLGANAALIQANTARDQGNTAFLGANAALIQANTARDQANTAFLGANAALIQANTARDQGNTAFLGANAALIQANTARTQANTAFLGANAALIQANTARDQGNTAFLGANAALIQANTARNQANDAYTQANSAFLRANSTTYTSNVVISVADNSNAALRITQTGTGDAIRVEDSANPDASPFVVDASGNVGIGITSPVYHIDAFAASGGVIGSFRTNGATGSDYGNIQAVAGGYFSNFIQYGSGLSLIATTGTQLTVQTNSTSPISFVTNLVERMRVDPAGNVLIGRTDSTVGLGVKLDVNGAINASAIYVNGAAQQSGAATYSANVGNNSANTFNVSHSLNKQFVIPAVRENSTGYYVYPDIKYTSVNTIVLEFVNAPTTNQYTVIVLG